MVSGTHAATVSKDSTTEISIRAILASDKCIITISLQDLNRVLTASLRERLSVEPCFYIAISPKIPSYKLGNITTAIGMVIM